MAGGSVAELLDEPVEALGVPLRLRLRRLAFDPGILGADPADFLLGIDLADGTGRRGPDLGGGREGDARLVEEVLQLRGFAGGLDDGRPEGGLFGRRRLQRLGIGGEVVGSVRMTPVAAGRGRALLLGPLAVRPAHKNVGIGRKLVRIAIDAAGQASQPAVLLVGDAPYYGPLGFSKMPPGQIVMPGPVDPHRMLGLELTAGSLALLGGPLVHQSLVRCRAG